MAEQEKVRKIKQAQKQKEQREKIKQEKKEKVKKIREARREKIKREREGKAKVRPAPSKPKVKTKAESEQQRKQLLKQIKEKQAKFDKRQKELRAKEKKAKVKPKPAPKIPRVVPKPKRKLTKAESEQLAKQKARNLEIIRKRLKPRRAVIKSPKEKKIKERERTKRIEQILRTVPQIELPEPVQRVEIIPPVKEEKEEIKIPGPAEQSPPVEDIPEPEELPDVMEKSTSKIIREEEERLFESLAEFEREIKLNPYDIQLKILLEQHGRTIRNFLEKPNSELITLKMLPKWANDLRPIHGMVNAFNNAKELATKPEHIEVVRRLWLQFIQNQSKRLNVSIGF